MHHVLSSNKQEQTQSTTISTTAGTKRTKQETALRPLGTGEIIGQEELVCHGGHGRLHQICDTAVALPGKEAMHVAPALLEHFYTFGIPQQLVTDQGREYCNELEKIMWTALKIRHDVTTPYHPQYNARAETFNKVIKHYMATAIADAEASTLDWEAYLAPLLFSYNT
jgi:hypothetical protein